VEVLSMMKQIKVYNIKSYIESLTFNQEKYTTATDDKLAIIEGINGVLIIDKEGCGGGYADIDKEYYIPLFDLKDKENKIYMGKSDFEHTMTIRKMIENVPYKKMTLIQFMEGWEFKRRIRENLEEVLDYLNKIGLDSKKYCTQAFINKSYKGFY
jgi:hypothetical protein